MLIGVEGVPHILTSSSHFYQAKIPVIHYNQSLAYQFFLPYLTFHINLQTCYHISSRLKKNYITSISLCKCWPIVLFLVILVCFLHQNRSYHFNTEILCWNSSMASQPIKNTSLSSYKVYEHYVTSLTSPVTVHLVPSPLTLTPFVVFWTCHTFFHNSLFVCC